MIRIMLGNVGSGKTVGMVREMYLDRTQRMTYSNIKTRIKNQINLDPSMIIMKDLVDTKTNKKTGQTTPVYELKLNIDFWKEKQGAINVILDEAHSIVNARRAMSKTNIIITDWLALIRRVLGSKDSSHGELTFITQLPNRLDVIARDMATQVRYHICHYLKRCEKCGCVWSEHSEMPERLWICPQCTHYKIKKFNHQIEVFKFANMKSFEIWNEMKMITYYERYFINDIEKYFPLYNTMQWDNLFGEYY